MIIFLQKEDYLKIKSKLRENNLPFVIYNFIDENYDKNIELNIEIINSIFSLLDKSTFFKFSILFKKELNIILEYKDLTPNKSKENYLFLKKLTNFSILEDNINIEKEIIKKLTKINKDNIIIHKLNTYSNNLRLINLFKKNK